MYKYWCNGRPALLDYNIPTCSLSNLELYPHTVDFLVSSLQGNRAEFRISRRLYWNMWLLLASRVTRLWDYVALYMPISLTSRFIICFISNCRVSLYRPVCGLSLVTQTTSVRYWCGRGSTSRLLAHWRGQSMCQLSRLSSPIYCSPG